MTAVLLALLCAVWFTGGYLWCQYRAERAKDKRETDTLRLEIRASIHSATVGRRYDMPIADQLRAYTFYDVLAAKMVRQP